ncbi:MAG: LPXTG cell wall anchor domain-containing protein [Herbiconiux sp.]|nr:MAG: LPXTG cell wall anchor domain-containing protein [Herbiconiux sp.]
MQPPADPGSTTVTLATDLSAGLASTGANGQIALIIGGIAVAVLVIGGIVLFISRRRRKN